jgi:hypothetical protein
MKVNGCHGIGSYLNEARIGGKTRYQVFTNATAGENSEVKKKAGAMCSSWSSCRQANKQYIECLPKTCLLSLSLIRTTSEGRVTLQVDLQPSGPSTYAAFPGQTTHLSRRLYNRKSRSSHLSMEIKKCKLSSNAA